MAEIGYKYKVIAGTKHGGRMKSEEPNYYYLANAIYSKIPIESHEIIQFKFTDRNFINITVKYKERLVNIINLHFEFFNDKSLNYPEIDDIVIKQFEILNEYFRKIDNRNIVICGDFNINLFEKIEHNKRYKENYEKKVELIRKYYKNTSQKSLITNFSQNTTTDYILTSKISKVRAFFTQVIKSNLSDHYPIIAYFK